MVWAVSLVGSESQPRSLKSFSSGLRKIIDLIPKFLGPCIFEEVVEEDASDITPASQRSCGNRNSHCRFSVKQGKIGNPKFSRGPGLSA